MLLFGGAYAEGYALANDQEQAVGRVFEIARRIVECSPLLKREAKITQNRIVFPAFNATIAAIASDAGSAACRQQDHHKNPAERRTFHAPTTPIATAAA